MDWYMVLDQWAAERLPQMDYVKEEPMARHTSFRIGGPARRMAFPTTWEELSLLAGKAAECGARPLVVGNGTNLLVPDRGLDRLVINTSGALNALSLEADGLHLTADAGVTLARLAVLAQQSGLTGLEFAHGIPGTVGGALCMNAGAYGGEMKQVVERVTLLDPARGVVTVSGEDMAFGYRRSILTDHPDWVALGARFRLSQGDPETIRARMTELMDRRRQSQPLEWPSAGSTFKRPEGHFAGALIQQSGLKGFSVGGAQVSEKHAGFVINTGGATCADVLGLIREVQRRVLAETGVAMEPEVRLIDMEGAEA